LVALTQFFTISRGPFRCRIASRRQHGGRSTVAFWGVTSLPPDPTVGCEDPLPEFEGFPQHGPVEGHNGPNSRASPAEPVDQQECLPPFSRQIALPPSAVRGTTSSGNLPFGAFERAEKKNIGSGGGNFGLARASFAWHREGESTPSNRASSVLRAHFRKASTTRHSIPSLGLARASPVSGGQPPRHGIQPGRISLSSIRAPRRAGRSAEKGGKRFPLQLQNAASPWRTEDSAIPLHVVRCLMQDRMVKRSPAAAQLGLLASRNVIAGF